MARIVVITHEFDCFQTYRFGLFLRRRFLLQDLLRAIKERGHEIVVAAGTEKVPDGDASILHIDCSLVPPAYAELARAFPVALNAETRDISKRRVSGAVLASDSDWPGPVIVKSNYNAGARGENFHNREAKRRRRPLPHPDVAGTFTYVTYDSASQVPDVIWHDQGLVVERLIPEPDPQGYAMRTWIFFGDRERCTRYVGPNRIIKGVDIVAREPVPVPDEMRQARRDLGFDFGKFDFVVHDGEAVLLDANRTPGSTRDMGKTFAAANEELSKGLESYLR